MAYRGVIYCATNHIIFLEAALISAIALHQLDPDLPITIVCDQVTYQPLDLEALGITLIQAPPVLEVSASDAQAFVSRNLKTHLAHLSPYQETLYIDSDILPLKSIASIWSYLAEADFAMVVDRMPTIAQCDHIAVVERDYTLASLAGHTTQFNSGLMVWRDNTQTRELFDQWQQEWHCFQKHDQLAMVRALATTQLQVAKLPVNYNISPIDAAPHLLPKNEVYLLHCWGGQIVSGDYRRIAKQFYPKIVDLVDGLLCKTLQDCLLSP